MTQKETHYPPPHQLFRYGPRRYIRPFLEKGRVSMAVAETYMDPMLTPGQRDNEMSRSLTPDFRLNFTGRDGEPLKYYLLCFSMVFDHALFVEFEADTCVRINDPETFGNRLLTEARRRFPDRDDRRGCDLYGRNVLYYRDGTLPTLTDQVELIFSKSERFKYQKEFRFIFCTNPRDVLPSRIEFVLGDLRDIAEMYDGERHA